MSYLMRVKVRPYDRMLNASELTEMNRIFDMHAGEVFIYGEPVGWEEIEEVELVNAPTVGGFATWIMRLFGNVDTENRYHLGVYLRRDEAVLANLSERQVKYALNAIAYYAPNPVRYKGPDGFAPLTAV